MNCVFTHIDLLILNPQGRRQPKTLGMFMPVCFIYNICRLEVDSTRPQINVLDAHDSLCLLPKAELHTSLLLLLLY